jgi:hypothetical protein
MVNAMQWVDGERVWCALSYEWYSIVGEAKVNEIENMWSLDDLGRYLLENSWLSPEQVEKISNELPPELIQMLEQPEQKKKFKTIIENMALFLASETNKPWARMAYLLDQIFINAKLWDAERIASATHDLLAGWLDHGLIDWAMSDVQQKRLFDVHGMYPEKWVFELNKEEKWGKYQALLNDEVFDVQQAKLLLDRGYAGTLGKIFSGISKIAHFGTIVGLLLVVYIFNQVGGCSAIKGAAALTKKTVEITKDVATPYINAWVDVAKFWGWLLAHISEALQSRALELASLKAEKEAIQKRLLDIKQRIEEINNNEPWYQFRDGEVEDELQNQERELEKRLVDLEKNIFDTAAAIREELANQNRVNAPFKWAMAAFTEKRGDVKERTAEQWKEFDEHMANIGGGWSRSTKEQIQQEEEAKAQQKHTEDADEMRKKWRLDSW